MDDMTMWGFGDLCVPLVIPAKAGIQGHTLNTLPVALDSRFRGNDD